MKMGDQYYREFRSVQKSTKAASADLPRGPRACEAVGNESLAAATRDSLLSFDFIPSVEDWLAVLQRGLLDASMA